MSTPMSELLHVDEWLKAVLEAGVPGISGAYADLIPPSVELPAIRYTVMAPGTDMTVINGIRIWANPLYLVAGVVEGSPVPLVPIADAIESVLHRATGETTTIRIQSCVREEPFKLAELSPGADGRIIRHAGGLYRIKVQAK